MWYWSVDLLTWQLPITVNIISKIYAVIQDGSLSRDLSEFIASPLNGVHDLNCRSFFILLSSLPLIIGTFVTESTAVLWCTGPGTAFKNTLTREHFAVTLLRTINVSVWFLHGQKTYPHYHFCQIFCHTRNIPWSLINVHCLTKEVHYFPKDVYCLTEIFCVTKDRENPHIGDSADNPS